MNRVIAFAAFVSLSSCATAGTPEIPSCHEGPCIGISESQTFGIMRVTPLEVLADSRCPIEADCIWAGELRVRTQLDIGHETIEVEIEGYKPFVIHGGVLLLAEIAPDASVEWSRLEQGDYAFRFTFTPNIAD